MVTFLRLAVDAWPVVVVSAGDGDTHCSKVRSDNVQDGPSLRSQATTGSCGLSRAGAEDAHPLLCPFLASRSASTGDHRPMRPSFHLIEQPMLGF
jgi:hypothetical protein